MNIFMNLKNETRMEEKKTLDVSVLSKEEKAALLAQLQTEANNDRLARRESYEKLAQ